MVFMGLSAGLLFFEQDEDIDPYKLLLGAAHVFFGLGCVCATHFACVDLIVIFPVVVDMSFLSARFSCGGQVPS